MQDPTLQLFKLFLFWTSSHHNLLDGYCQHHVNTPFQLFLPTLRSWSMTLIDWSLGQCYHQYRSELCCVRQWTLPRRQRTAHAKDARCGRRDDEPFGAHHETAFISLAFQLSHPVDGRRVN